MHLLDIAEPDQPLPACDENAQPAVLILPGWDEPDHKHYDTLKAQLEGMGALVRVMRFPRKPEEKETLSSAQALERVLTVHDCLARQTGGGCMTVVGLSYGGYLAALLSGQRSIHAMALRSPALYPDAQLQEPKTSLGDAALRRFRENPPDVMENKALAACSKFKGHALLVACENDEIIPNVLIERYAACLHQAGSLQRHQLKCADHSLSEHAWRMEYSALLRQWMQEVAWVCAPAGEF